MCVKSQQETTCVEVPFLTLIKQGFLKFVFSGQIDPLPVHISRTTLSNINIELYATVKQPIWSRLEVKKR